ncbi:MAG: cysteine hydrolase [Methanosarcinaceae archaeon]|nr:cysteine hydrolase [Methanosarcinaceae archaeon]
MKLIIVDYQNDFVEEGGALDCGPAARAVEENIVRCIRHVRDEEGGQLLFTMDTHGPGQEGNVESRLFPEHCVYKEHGWYLYGRVGAESDIGDDNVFFEKDTYAAVHLIDEIGPGDDVFVCGVATDICVLNNVAFLRAYYPSLEITVIEDGCASFDEGAHKRAVGYMKNVLGCRISTTEGFVSGHLDAGCPEKQ